jgi:hypothetical protein
MAAVTRRSHWNWCGTPDRLRPEPIQLLEHTC